jgi:hypothetical protein
VRRQAWRARDRRDAPAGIRPLEALMQMAVSATQPGSRIRSQEVEEMKKLIATISLALLFAVAIVAFSATPAAAAPASPGACNMLHVADSAVGFAGMLNSSHGQGLDNMVDLVLTSEAAGCTP